MPAGRILRRCNSDETHGGGEGEGRREILKKSSSDGDIPDRAIDVGAEEIADDAETRALREEVAALQKRFAQLQAGSASTAAAPEVGGGGYTMLITVGTNPGLCVCVCVCVGIFVYLALFLSSRLPAAVCLCSQL